MKSYFFIPGTLYNNVSKVKAQLVDEVIIDLEDAVKGSEREKIINTLCNASDSRKYWLRVPLRESFEQEVDTNFLSLFMRNGFSKMVLPKLKSEEELKKVLNICKADVELVVLIEHPRLLIEIESFLLATHDIHIRSIGLGSHDLMSMMGAKHALSNLEYPRQKLLYTAKSVGIEAIDIASMELQRKDIFLEELKDGFEKGFDGKFLIHPWQLELFNNYTYYSEKDVEWATQVLKAYKLSGGSREFSPIVINDEVIERPHLNRARAIIKKMERNESK
ncbi:hypothetical protein I0P70_13245 [Pontibacter sp. FD36]|uniref:HpcH/HpaI aldolase/citrate lyase family protein n=1 Tax=Pontibacter sp. FD36 TaxID=2789860 RepID=UPI0018AA4016|nr:aldolase/citrate lyase family protein [Pontibacter sp. FD36]MBF8964214.1 hypothetical protein [Pontibacter sp. FD36]